MTTTSSADDRRSFPPSNISSSVASRPRAESLKLVSLSLTAMSWKLGRKSPKASKASLSAEDNAPRSTTPTPGNPNGSQIQTGLLTIHVASAEGLVLPAGSGMPSAVKAALQSAEAQVASSVSPSSVVQRRRNNRDSMQRVQCWWLPYVVLEFDVNQVIITPLGGDLASPVYMYQAHL